MWPPLVSTALQVGKHTPNSSRIMPVSGGGFEQAYNAQASVDMETMIIVGNHVSQQTNDKQEVEPALVQLDQLPESLGKVKKAALDSGFFSEHNTNCFEAKGIEPYIAAGRQTHNLSLEERLAPEPPGVSEKIGGDFKCSV